MFIQTLWSPRGALPPSTLPRAGCPHDDGQVTGTPADGLAPEDDRPAGCGWFDSSHELSAGLEVTEHASPDAVAGDLPLQGWLELHLSGWRGAVGVSAV